MKEKRHTVIKMILLLSLNIIFSINLFACSCCYYNSTFCNRVQGDSTELLALVNIYDVTWINQGYQEVAFVEVIDDLEENILPDTIVIKQDGSCSISLFGSLYDTLLLELYSNGMLYEYSAYSVLGACGVSTLKYRNDSLEGSILPNINKMSYLDFIENISDCISSPEYFRISGKVLSWIDLELGVDNFPMSINNYVVEPTDSNGRYRFDYVRLDDENYLQHDLIEPFSNEDLLRGITMADVIKIQKHIIDLDPFENPYQLIAADVNNSGSVSTLDILYLLKNILGQEDSFPNNDSWRFVEEGYSFSNPEDPWGDDFDAKISLNLCVDGGGGGTYDFVDIIAIKVGDVDGSYIDDI